VVLDESLIQNFFNRGSAFGRFLRHRRTGGNSHGARAAGCAQDRPGASKAALDLLSVSLASVTVGNAGGTSLYHKSLTNQRRQGKRSAGMIRRRRGRSWRPAGRAKWTSVPSRRKGAAADARPTGNREVYSGRNALDLRNPHPGRGRQAETCSDRNTKRVHIYGAAASVSQAPAAHPA
jgi:hypothetical protein